MLSKNLLHRKLTYRANITQYCTRVTHEVLTIVKINSLNFFNEESSLIAWFRFLEFLFILIFQLLKMIVDAEHDFDKTKESVCEKQGGLLKLNCRLLNSYVRLLTSFQPWII